MCKRLLPLLVSALLWAHPAYAAISVVTTNVAVCNGNDCTLTFAGNWAQNNIVVVFVRMNNPSQTVDLTGISETESDLHPTVDDAGGSRMNIKCFVVDGTADLDVIVTTSGAATTHSLGVELSGTNGCTEDGTSTDNADSGDTSYALSTGVTTATCGSIVFGYIESSTASNFSKDASYTALGNGGHASEADYSGGDNVGNSLVEYLITSATGTYAPTFTSQAAETAHIFGVGIAPSSACAAATGYPNLLLLGVG